MRKFYGIILALLLAGCATNGGPFDKQFWKDVIPGLDTAKHPVVIEVIDPDPIEVPQKYKDWGWTVEDYEALLACKEAGGKMGSSKECRK